MKKKIVLVIIMGLGLMGFLSLPGNSTILASQEETLNQEDIPTPPAPPVINDKKLKIKRGTEEQERKLYSYLYYFKGDRLQRIDTDSAAEITLENEQLKNKCYFTYINPNENETGNRYIVFYRNQVEGDPSFVVYDKLTNRFDVNSYQLMQEPQEYKRIETIYPVDYSAGGDYIHAVFIVVYTYIKEGARKFALVQYGKSEDDRVRRKELALDIISHYYNPYEKKLAWLTRTSPGKLELRTYDAVHEETSHPKMLSCSPGDFAAIQFLAYNYFVINLNNRSTGNVKNNIYHLNKEKPIDEYSHCKLFSKSLMHNSGEFHLLIWGRKGNSKTAFLHHKNFDENAVGLKLKDGCVPKEVSDAVINDKDIEHVLFPVRRNTYYICIVSRSTRGYRLTFFKLNENFKQVRGNPETPSLPHWLKKSDGDLVFRTEGNAIMIQTLTSGQIKGIAYIDKKGKIRFIPQESINNYQL